MFPTTSTPSYIDEQSSFNTISTEFDGGYKQTRERHTRDVKKFIVNYNSISKTQKDELLAHFYTCKGSTIFTWENIDTGITHNVRYTSAPQAPADASTPNLYNVTIELEEV